MINLLPSKVKREILAGRSNILLWRYCVTSLILMGLLLVAVGGVYLLMNHAKADAERTIANSNHQAEKYKEVQQQFDTFSQNLKTAKAILDKDVRYSKIALKIAQALPPGVILQTLNLDAKSFNQPVVLNARGKSYNDALSLKQSFEKSSLFKDVNLGSVVLEKDNKNGYPVMITMNVTILAEAAKQ